MHEKLAGFPVVVEIPVAWGEMDSFGHVNNTIYLRYFETARIAYFQRISLFPVAHDSGIGPILASAQCNFKFPLTYPDTVWAATRAIAIGADRVTMAHVVVSQRHSRVAAEGECVIVSYDYHAGRKTPLPDELRARIETIEAQSGSGA